MDTKNNNNNELKDENNKRIMIIDDDIDITNLFKIFLEINGYKVEAFTDPVKALNSFRKNNHDLILLDLNGITLYKKIKEIDEQVIICLISADHNYIQNLKKGIIDIEKIVIYKPILLKDLKNKIDSLVNDKYLKTGMRINKY